MREGIRVGFTLPLWDERPHTAPGPISGITVGLVVSEPVTLAKYLEMYNGTVPVPGSDWGDRGNWWDLWERYMFAPGFRLLMGGPLLSGR